MKRYRIFDKTYYDIDNHCVVGWFTLERKTLLGWVFVQHATTAEVLHNSLKEVARVQALRTLPRYFLA